MSSVRVLQAIRNVFVLAASAAILLTSFPAIGAAQAPGDCPQAAAAASAQVSVSTQTHDGADFAGKSLWSNYLWQAIPASDLRGLTPGPVSKAYAASEWQPLFINSRFELDSKAKSLLTLLRSADKDAMDPGPFALDRLSEILKQLADCRAALRTADPQFASASSQTLGATPGAYGATEASASQPANPGVITEDFRRCFRAASEADVRLTTDFFLYTKQMDPYSPFEESLQVLLGNTPLSTYLAGLEPKGFGYKALLSAYRRYLKLAANGGQQYVNFASSARPGDAGREIGLLQKRLRQEDFYAGRITGVYDRATERSVKRFQRAHMLTPDGVVGRQTIDWLNVPFHQKAALIAYSLQAVRNSPSRRFKRFIRVNIPQFMLDYYNNGQIEKSDKVVVGRASGKKIDRGGQIVGENTTPTMVSQIYQIVLNPRWYVDGRIRAELNKHAGSNPEWFTEHGYVKMESRYESQYAFGEHRLYQQSGPKNALGRVKFEFPNPYVVYLHDTNEKSLFARSRRDFSHGCIRVQNALQLAQAVLNDEGNPFAQKMDSILEGTRQVFVKLSKPVPISVEYIPVVAAGSGSVIFAGDPYGVVSESSQLADRLN
ncbi:MAG: L,D-transpeptidase family protein [Syntrophobacteraceae bacterium]